MMATYFNGGSEIQADTLQTLYLMNPSYAAYSDNQPPPGGMLLLNHAPPSQQQLVGIPLAPTGSGDDPGLHDIPSSAGGLVPRLQYNLWGAVASDPPSSGGHHIPTAIAVSGGGDFGPPMSFRRPPPVALADQPQQQQGLSLSLNNSSPHKHVPGGAGSPASVSGVASLGGDGGPSTIMRSKYLKPAQQLLDEVVNVGKALDMADVSKHKAKAKSAVAAGEGSSHRVGGEGSSCAASTTDLTTAQRQELQMKKAKLLNMLDEVEQRYRQYHSQMQMVVSSFEQAAGAGSARSYTALALQTISKQFRCLKDAIASQIRATGEDVGTSSSCRSSRLRLVDYQLRQQRALQQLGMMQHNAWRPQRGLPERAVSVLRAWLFEHFLHPYPKDSDKHMLAKQTGLTRSQVSNWFINARVRLWKPMVEEMYLEEIKSQDQNQSDDQTHNNKNSTKPTPTERAPRTNQTPLAPPVPTANSTATSAAVNLHGVGALQGFSLKRQRSSSDMQNSPSSILSMDMEMKPAEDPSGDLFNPGGFGAYPIGDIGSRFNPNHQHFGQCYQQGNAVSLTLGLPHGDRNFIPGQAHSQRLDIGIGDTEFCGQPQHSGGSRGYDGMDIENRKGYAAQLLPDFVA